MPYRPDHPFRSGVIAGVWQSGKSFPPIRARYLPRYIGGIPGLLGAGLCCLIAAMFVQYASKEKPARSAPFAALILALLLLATAVISASLSVPASSEETGSPLLWKVEQGDSTLYLLGTFHLLTEDVRWMDDRIASALDSADELVLEISEEQTEPNLLVNLVREKGMYRRAGKLQELLSKETWQDLVQQAGGLGIPGQVIGQFRPWYAAIVLTLQYAQAQGFKPEFGVEAVLTVRAKAEGKPIRGLETAQQQLAALAGHSDRIQVLMLEDTLQQLDDLPRILDDMTQVWVTGDEDGIVELVIGSALEVPELYDALIQQRNRNWIPQLTGRLQQPGVFFVAVGVAHLVGEDSVVALLRDEGYDVQPVR